MSAIHIALLGHGTVGKGVYATIQSHQKKLQALFGKEVKIVGVLVKNLYKHHLEDPSVLLTDDFKKIISLEKLDVVIDAISGKEPCYSYLKQAIQRGCHVITANKEMFAHHGADLKQLAIENNVSLGFEATVAGGIPVIQTLRQLLNVNNIQKIQGILNGTSNFILTKMREENLSFESALKLAQDNGFAEADPTNDIEGFDAFYKAMILSEVAFGKSPDWEQVIRQGIRGISYEQIELFSSLGLRFKHVASIEQTANGIQCSVKPVLVNKQHPFYHVEGVQNAVSIDGDIVGNISLQGPGAGMFPTASAIVEDLVHIDRKITAPSHSEQKFAKSEAAVVSYWAICGDLNTSLLPPATEVIERVHHNVFIVRSSEEDFLNSIQIPHVQIYQVLGEVYKEKVVATY